MTPQQRNNLREIKEMAGMLAGVIFLCAVVMIPVWAILLGV